MKRRDQKALVTKDSKANRHILTSESESSSSESDEEEVQCIMDDAEME